MERSDGGLVQVSDALAAAGTLFFAAGLIGRCFFQPLADAVAQLGGGGLGKRYGGDSVEGGPSSRHQVHHPPHQACRLAGARAGLDKQRFIQLLADDAAGLGVDGTQFCRTGAGGRWSGGHRYFSFPSPDRAR